MPSPRASARRVHLEGRVQGVGFRWHTRLEARALGLTGWVRNLDDGSVEVLIQGSTQGVEEMLHWLRVGPSGAHVDECHVTSVETEALDHFKIL